MTLSTIGFTNRQKLFRSMLALFVFLCGLCGSSLRAPRLKALAPRSARATPQSPRQVDILRRQYILGICPEKPVRSSVLRLALLILTVTAVAQQAQQQPAPKPIFKLQEVMIPVRDGVRLQTAILYPADQHGPLPIDRKSVV